MPEHAEIRLMADYINQKTKDIIFLIVEKNVISKQTFEAHKLPNEFYLKAVSRGKEIQIQHIPAHSMSPSEAEIVKLTITMGMSGNFIFQSNGGKSKWPMLVWFSKANTQTKNTQQIHNRLELVDHRRFAKWKFRDWNPDRGPDVVFEHEEFRKKILEGISSNLKKLDKPLCEFLMDQSFFNGIGNYLIAEILGKLNVNPFQTIFNLKKRKLNELLDLCLEKPQEAYVLGGGQLKDWKNQNNINAADFKSWLKFYQKGESVVTGTGRNFWYNKKWSKFSPYAN